MGYSLHVESVFERAEALQNLYAIKANKELIQESAEILLRKVYEIGGWENTRRRTITEFGVIELKHDGKKRYHYLRAGICGNSKIDVLLSHNTTSALMASWPHCNESKCAIVEGRMIRTHMYPVGGSEEYSKNYGLGLWLNEKRWDLVDYLIAELEKAQ